MDAAYSGLIGVVVRLLVNPAIHCLKARRSRKRRVRYLMVRISSFLDRFADRCLLMTMDEGFGKYGTSGTASPQVEQPTFETGSLEVDWETITHDVLYKILNFPSLVHAAENEVVQIFDADHSGERSLAFEVRKFEYARLGIKATELSNGLRQRCKIPRRNLQDFDPKGILLRTINENRKKEEAHQETMSTVRAGLGDLTTEYK